MVDALTKMLPMKLFARHGIRMRLRYVSCTWHIVPSERLLEIVLHNYHVAHSKSSFVVCYG